MQKGKLIAFEGIDGAGKSTLLDILVPHIRNSASCIYYKEPSQNLKDYFLITAHERIIPIEEEIKLFTLDRQYWTLMKVKSWLNTFRYVISDRSYLSSIAYQSIRGGDAEEIRKLNEEFVIKPDLIIYLDIEPEIAVERIKKIRRLDNFEQLEHLKQIKLVYQQYLPTFNHIIINTNQSFETVSNELIEKFDKIHLTI